MYGPGVPCARAAVRPSDYSTIKSIYRRNVCGQQCRKHMNREAHAGNPSIFAANVDGSWSDNLITTMRPPGHTVCWSHRKQTYFSNFPFGRACAVFIPVGLVLNTDKTKVMTTEAQPPPFLSTPAGLQIEILDQQSCQQMAWLHVEYVSMPTVNKKRHDVDQHLQAASKAFFCHRAALCDRNVSIGKKLRYFHAVISPVAVFAAGTPNTVQDRPAQL